MAPSGCSVYRRPLGKKCALAGTDRVCRGRDCPRSGSSPGDFQQALTARSGAGRARTRRKICLSQEPRPDDWGNSPGLVTAVAECRRKGRSQAEPVLRGLRAGHLRQERTGCRRKVPVARHGKVFPVERKTSRHDDHERRADSSNSGSVQPAGRNSWIVAGRAWRELSVCEMASMSAGE